MVVSIVTMCMQLSECSVEVSQSDLLFVCPQPTLVENMTEFKRSLPLFPLVKPHINFMAAKLWAAAGGHADGPGGGGGPALFITPPLLPIRKTLIWLSLHECVCVCVFGWVHVSACVRVCVCVDVCGRPEPLQEKQTCVFESQTAAAIDVAAIRIHARLATRSSLWGATALTHHHTV